MSAVSARTTDGPIVTPSHRTEFAGSLGPDAQEGEPPLRSVV